MLVLGTIAGGLMMGLYLVLTNLALGMHVEETFSSQALTGYKNFLRLRGGRAGALSIYAVGIDRVLARRDWDPDPPRADEHASRIAPREGCTLEPHVIERIDVTALRMRG